MTAGKPRAEGNRRAVVLSGGGADGAYGAGVLKALMAGKSAAAGDRPFEPEIFTGTSIGSFNAAYLVARWDERGAASVRDLERVWLDRLAEKSMGGRTKAYRVRLNPLDVLDPRSYLPTPFRQIADTAKDSAELGWQGLQRMFHFASANDEALLRRTLEMIDFSALISPEPWHSLVRDEIDYPSIRRSSRHLRIAAVNWKTGELRVFENDEFTDTRGPEAVAASTALPGFFPPAKVGDQPFVDGAVLLNTPLRPAIHAGGSEIHVIYLDPPVDKIALAKPSNTLETLYRMQQISWAATVRADVATAERMNWVIESLEASRAHEELPEAVEEFGKRYGKRRKLTIHNHYPKEDFGGALGLLNLKRSRLERLMRLGYADAAGHSCEENGCIIPGALPGKGTGTGGGAVWIPGVGRPPGGVDRDCDPAVFVVLGEDLAAGMGHFSLESTSQKHSFPAQLARAMGTELAQPLIEPPGVGDAPGLAEQEVIVPDLLQTSVLNPLPEEPNFGNLSVPGFTLADALECRPVSPVVHRDDSKQTLTNLVLGLPGLLGSFEPGPTQLEYAKARNPTLALVALGYREAVGAAIAGDAGAIPDAPTFRERYGRLLEGLCGVETVLAVTVPDPFDTAYFSDLATAARILKTVPAFLEEHFGLASDDLVTLPGLMEIGYRMMNREVGPLERSPAVGASAAVAVSAAVAGVNVAISAAARGAGALVYDLHGVFAGLAREGVEIAGKALTADYLGGLYLLNGLYPGRTLNALIASDIARWLGGACGRTFAETDLAAIAAEDPNTEARLAPGPPATDEFLKPRTPAELPPPPPLDPPPVPVPIQTTYPGIMPGKAGCTPVVGVPAGGYSDPELPLELPEDLEQTLELNPAGSYFGDALRVVDCPDDKSLFPPEMGIPPFGLCGNTYFGGTVLTSSQLHGKIHVKFSPPDENNVSTFEIRHPGGLMGEDAELAAPKLFRMRSQFTFIQDIPELVSSGELDLDTGRVTNFHYNLRNFNTALLTLLRVNPNLPPVALLFPGQPGGGSTWARFEQRSDGLLDLTLAANMFLPLGLEWGGEPLRFALPFGTPDLETASFLARGTSLHPRIHITTREQVVEHAQPEGESSEAPEIPFNTVQEYTAITRKTSFGDVFRLRSPDLGDGGAVGRSQLMGRVRVQFGPRTGASAPVLFQVLPPGGLLSDQPPMPRGLSRGMSGFDAELRFPELAYAQSGLASVDDPFNLAVGNVELQSGKIVDELLFRSFVFQELFKTLIQVEPCTPSDSFNYQGLASFVQGGGGQTMLRFNGTVFVPYPEGFNFPSPSPDGRPAIVIGPDSRLDPFRRIRAVSRSAVQTRTLKGSAKNLVSSLGEKFSYRYSIPPYSIPPGSSSKPAFFEYTNHTTGNTFELTGLSWLDCSYGTAASSASDRPETVTFSGFGTWSEDPGPGRHLVSVQISRAQGVRYVGIQVDGGATSNVDTKPPAIEDTYA